MLWVLGGGVPALALVGVTCRRESLKAGGRMDVGGGGERTLPSHGCVVPALLLAEMLCAASRGAGERGGSRVPSPAGCAAKSAVHPAPRCRCQTLWDIQGDASRHPRTQTAIAGVLGLLEKQQSKPQVFLASVA